MLYIRDAYGEVLQEIGLKNSKIVVLDADLSSSTRTSKFAQKFPDRFFNIGVSEQDMIGTAAGLAAGGKISFTSTFAIFATGRAWEQIRQCVCLPKFNVKVVATHAGITVGQDGASHHSTEDIALMRVLPNMKVIVPADANETKAAIRFAAETDGPFYIRLSREKFPTLYNEDEATIMESCVSRQHSTGKDATIFACGLMVSKAIEASEILAKEGLSVGVVNMYSLKPVDSKTIIKAAKESGAIVSVEEHSIIGGLGSAIAEVLSENEPVIFKRIGIKDCFGMSGKPAELLEHFGLTASNISEEVRKIVALKYKNRALHQPEIRSLNDSALPC